MTDQEKEHFESRILSLIPKSKMSQEELTQVSQLVNGGNKFIDKLASAPLTEHLRAAAKMSGLLDAGKAVLKPLIGHILLRIQNEKLYEDMGFKDFTSFMNNGAQQKFGVGTSEAWGATRFAKKFPNMPVADAAALGPARMRLVARATSEGQDNYENEIKKAKRMTVEQYEDHVKKTYAVPREAIYPGTIVVPCTREEQGRWEEWVKDEDVIEEAGERPAQILMAMIEECEEWRARAYDDERV